MFIAIMMILASIGVQYLQKEANKQGNPIRQMLRIKWFNLMNVEDFMTNENEFLEEAGGIPETVPEIDYSEIDKKMFYKKYLSKSRPVLIKGMAQEWPAFTLWANETYLMETAGKIKIKVEQIPRH